MTAVSLEAELPDRRAPTTTLNDTLALLSRPLAGVNEPPRMPRPSLWASPARSPLVLSRAVVLREEDMGGLPGMFALPPRCLEGA